MLRQRFDKPLTNLIARLFALSAFFGVTAFGTPSADASEYSALPVEVEQSGLLAKTLEDYVEGDKADRVTFGNEVISYTAEVAGTAGEVANTNNMGLVVSESLILESEESERINLSHGFEDISGTGDNNVGMVKPTSESGRIQIQSQVQNEAQSVKSTLHIMPDSLPEENLRPYSLDALLTNSTPIKSPQSEQEEPEFVTYTTEETDLTKYLIDENPSYANVRVRSLDAGSQDKNVTELFTDDSVGHYFSDDVQIVEGTLLHPTYNQVRSLKKFEEATKSISDYLSLTWKDDTNTTSESEITNRLSNTERQVEQGLTGSVPMSLRGRKLICGRGNPAVWSYSAIFILSFVISNSSEAEFSGILLTSSTLTS